MKVIQKLTSKVHFCLPAPLKSDYCELGKDESVGKYVLAQARARVPMQPTDDISSLCIKTVTVHVNISTDELFPVNCSLVNSNCT